MRIGIDYTAAVRQGAGIGRYARNLVRALLDLDKQSEYVLLVAGAGIPRVADLLEPLTSGAGAKLVNLPVTDRTLAILWHRLRLPLWVELACGDLDCFYSPDFTLPPVRRARTILTVHDLSFMRVPECSEPGLRQYLLKAVPASVRRADCILADSECTRGDVIELLGVDAHKVKVVYPGVEPRFRPVQDARELAAVRTRYALPNRFVLGLGTLQPRKNFGRLIEGYAQIRCDLSEDTQLVIAGGKGWLYDDIFQRVEQLGLGNVVHFPGYVDDKDLPALYSLADLFAFPSLYEGFGIPPLEAMACGTPVVTSSVSSLPEVVGDAALLVKPTDVDALAEALREALLSRRLRDKLIQQGLDRAKEFTWARGARQVLALCGVLG